jgi:glycosyltransferase involved in cell wall biosynthesis
VTDRPLVSIVTPTLNQGRFIEATIRSIRAQTYDHFEHIVIDGGSTDDTLDILRRYEGSYPMRWLSEPDNGMYDAINKGMKLASGEILAYLNSDDLYFPWTLETVVEAFGRNAEADVVFGDALGIDADGREDIRFQPSHRYGFLLRSSSFVQPAVFWRRAVYDEIGGFDPELRLAGDLDYWLRMGPDRVHQRVDEVLAIERDHGLTQRSQQWDKLMDESRFARKRAGAGTEIEQKRGLVGERFRAWASKRVLWKRFAVEVARARRWSPRAWTRYLGVQHVQMSLGRVVLGQLPWVGRRVIAGAVSSGIDWIRLYEDGTPDMAPHRRQAERVRE